MRSRVGILLTLALVGLTSLGTRAQTPSQSADSSERPAGPFTSGATAVMVDVVVRDRQGNPVTDLRREDFELLEDGARQNVADMTLVAPGPRQSTPATTPSIPTAGRVPGRDSADAADGTRAQPPTVVALVFDKLSPEARALAYQGALSYLESSAENDYAGVFVTDLGLEAIQTYTNDRARLREAIYEAATRATSRFDRDATLTAIKQIKELRSITQGDAHPSVPVTASAEFTGRPVPIGSSSSGYSATQDEITLAELELSRHNTWEQLARDQQGYATTDALLALCTSLGSLPGRKTIVFFAEGLSIPDAVLPHFRDVIATANRANVSIYTIDSAGLRVHSKDAEISREVSAIGAGGLIIGSDGSNATTLAALERNEDVLRKDPRTSLTLLAQGTGAFLVENTNDLGRAFRDIDADRRFHYLLTYTPKNTAFNGEWRSISVKVPGRRVTVRHRTGYLAVRTPATVPLLAYEGPALAALEQPATPSEIPVRTGAFVFPQPDGPPRVAVLVAAHASGLRFEQTGSEYRTDFTVLARLADSQGRIVRKGSRPYRLTGPAGQVDEARSGEVLFFRSPELGAGTYRLEAVVYDALARRAGVARQPLTVPEPGSALQVGSLVLMARAEPLAAEDRDSENPLHLGEVLIYPNLGETIRRTPDAKLAFLLSLILRDAAVAPSLTLEVLRDGKPLVKAPLVVGSPDAEGRIQQIGQMPLSKLSPGNYVLRVTVEQGGSREIREAGFTVQDSTK